MKGQFFLLGTFLFITMFYTGISVFISPSQTSVSAIDDLEDLFENIENEYPRVLNFGLNDSSHVSKLVNFTDFAINLTKGRGSSLHAIWLVTENVSDDLNITVGNFLGYSATVTLNVSGDVEEVYVDNGETGSLLFTSPQSEFELGLNFNTTEKNLLLEKYKVNLYLILEMRKGGNKITGEIKA